jgi:hypothetical protein
MDPSNQSEKQNSPKPSVSKGGSPISKKGRLVITPHKLPFSNKNQQTKIHKVFVRGAPLGIILIRTEKQNLSDDAFTYNAQKILQDVTTGAASRLNIIKICPRRVSQLIDKAILQKSNYPSQWFVSITNEEKNTPEYRLEHVTEFMKFLNETEFLYPQEFRLQADETKMENGQIAGSLDMFLLTEDIATIVKEYVHKQLETFLEDEDAIKACFGPKCTPEMAEEYVKQAYE